MKSVVRFLGIVIAGVATVLLFVLDMYSLFLLAEKFGLIWAVIAFLVVPSHVVVPFLVGTWVLAIGLGIAIVIGVALVSASED